MCFIVTLMLSSIINYSFCSRSITYYFIPKNISPRSIYIALDQTGTNDHDEIVQSFTVVHRHFCDVVGSAFVGRKTFSNLRPYTICYCGCATYNHGLQHPPGVQWSTHRAVLYWNVRATHIAGADECFELLQDDHDCWDIQELLVNDIKITGISNPSGRQHFPMPRHDCSVTRIGTETSTEDHME